MVVPADHGAADRRALVELDRDHPGFRDLAYRRRRDAIARIARAHVSGAPVRDVPYTDEEHAVWRHVLDALAPLHAARVCAPLRAAAAALALRGDRVPQFSALNPRLVAARGLRMEPVEGLVSPQVFLVWLARGVFLATQYVRHHSRPLYTPEPDVIHELVGHAASLTHPGIVSVSQAFGRAALSASPARLQELINLYWYTLEFGACEEDGRVVAVGAGLLSSIGELTRFDTRAELMPWDIDRAAATPFDPTEYQGCVFVAPSFDRMLSDLSDWLVTGDDAH